MSSVFFKRESRARSRIKLMDRERFRIEERSCEIKMFSAVSLRASSGERKMV